MIVNPQNVEGRSAFQDVEGRSAFYRALGNAQRKAPRLINAPEKHFHGFKYVPEKIYEMVLVPILLEEDLVVTVAGVGPPDDLELQTKKGELQWMTTQEVVFRLTHTGSGYSEVYRIQGRRTNDADKGVSQAISSASKSFFQYVLQVREDEDSDTMEKLADAAVASKGNVKKAGSRPPPPPENQGPTAKEEVEKSKLTPVERKKLVQEDVRSLMRKQRLRIYHIEALGEIDPNLPEEMDLWGVSDWEMVREVMRDDVGRFDLAVKKLAEDFPTDETRVEKLKDLERRLREDGRKVQSDESIHIATAIQVGWNDAVEYWILKLSARLKGQTEADV